MGTLVLVVAAVYIADADFRLYAPMFREQPLIAVGNAGSQHPAFETVILQLAEIGTQESEIGVPVSHVVNAAQQVGT